MEANPPPTDNVKKQRSDASPAQVYAFATGVMGQVGCLLTISIAVLMALGIVLDQLLGTKPTLLLVALLGSIPLNIFLIFRYTIHKSKQLQDVSSPHKEDVISED